MKKQNPLVKKMFGMIKKVKESNIIIIILGVIIFSFVSSFVIYQNENSKIAGTLINNLRIDLGKRGGCDNTKDALVLMEAYQIIFREFGGVIDRKEKVSDIRELLNNHNCTTSVGDIVFNPRDLKPAIITTINGGISIKREVPPYILALEMMTPKQKEEFQKSLPKNLQVKYINWGENNLEVKTEINKNLISKKIIPIDLDKNLSELFQKAIEKNTSIKLDEYQIDKKELNKLLNNQVLIKELNNQLIIKKN